MEGHHFDSTDPLALIKALRILQQFFNEMRRCPSSPASAANIDAVLDFPF